MANLDEQPDDVDPEIDMLLVGIPPDYQQLVRNSMRLRASMSPDEWLILRTALINDLKFYHEKKRLEQFIGETQVEMQELHESISELKELKKELDSLDNTQQNVYDRLKEVAKNGGLITYGEITHLAKLKMDNPDDRNKIADILGEISKDEIRQGRPLLSAIVVSARTGYPSEGFFILARKLGLHHGTGVMDDLDFFKQEMNRVHTYWKNHNE